MIMISDFDQFPPVGESPLYCGAAAAANSEHEKLMSQLGARDNTRATARTNKLLLGRTLWLQFDMVVVLDQQMRQADDTQFHALLQRLCKGVSTQQDFQLLSSRILQTGIN
jgi:hypothetical protein